MAERRGIMLCHPFEEKRLTHWAKPYIMQPKLDGVRCIADLRDGPDPTPIALRSSTDKEQISVPHIQAQLRKLGLFGIKLDGELYIHGMSFQQINSIVSRKQNMHPDFHRIEYHIFDVMVVESQIKRIERLMRIADKIKLLGIDNICVVPHLWAESVRDIFAHAEYYIGEGYEGFIVRNPAGLYELKRSAHIMKFKPRGRDCYQIVDTVEEVSLSGKPKGRLGALWLQDKEGNRFKAGSGPVLTADGRDALWKDREGLIGKYATIKFQGFTDDKVPRFPILFEISDTPTE